MQKAKRIFNNDNTLFYLVFIFILTLAAILRLYHLDHMSLWFDELHTWRSVSENSFSAFWTSFLHNELTPPLFFIMEFFAQKLSPTMNEYSLRLPSVLYGLGLVVTIYYFAKELSGNSRWAGLLASSFVATSYRAILFSQEARAYSLMLCLAAALGWAWVRVYKNQNKKNLLIYFIFATAISYTHYFGVIYVMAQGLSLLVAWSLDKKSRAQNLKYWLLLYTLPALAFLPWMYVVITHYIPEDNLMITAAPPLSEFFIAHRDLFGGSSVNGILATLLAIIACIKVRPTKAQWSVLSWIILVFLLGWAISYIRPIYSNRYFMVVLPAMLTMAAVGTYWLSKKSRPLAIVIGLLFCLLGLHESIIAQQVYSVPKEVQIREATQNSIDFLSANPQAAYALIGIDEKAFSFYSEMLKAPKKLDQFFLNETQFLNSQNWNETLKASSKMILVIYTYKNLDEISKLLESKFTIIKRSDSHLGAAYELDTKFPNRQKTN